jgi:hypothetical protein
MKNEEKIDIKYLGIPNICFSLTSKDDKREEEFIEQRKQNGFDDSETWSLRDTIGRFILPRLKRFKEVTIAHPGGLKEEEWDEILDKMIKAFELLTKENGAFMLTEGEYKEFEEGMDLFRKWFLALWW